MSFRIIKGPGNRTFEVKVKRLDRDFTNGIRRAFYYAGKDFKATANREIIRKKTGTVYPVRLGSRLVRIAAGAPGDYPANRTGENRRSIDFIVQSGNEMEFGAGEKYSPYLEQGTRTMRARPFLKPSIEKNERNFRNHLRREIGRSLGKRP